jgi:hypothetical protein
VIFLKQYEYTPLYYGTPCQVRFVDCGDPNKIIACYGIAYKDEIICGCCGAILSIDGVIKDAEKAGVHWDDAIIELEWIDISENIKGE